MIDASDDLRLALASALHPGDALELVAAGGAQLDVEIERIDGVDFRVHIDSPVPLPVGSLLAGRVHDGAEAWFCTFIALDAAEDPEGGQVLAVRLGDADRIATERWSERRALGCPALLRREGSNDVLRGVTVDASAVGIAVQLRGGDATVGTMLGVTLAGLGGGPSRSAASCAGVRGRARAACWASRSPTSRPRTARGSCVRSVPPAPEPRCRP